VPIQGLILCLPRRKRLSNRIRVLFVWNPDSVQLEPLCSRHKGSFLVSDKEVRRLAWMSREKKAKVIDSLEETFSKCSIGILTDYRGLSAHEMTLLRRKLGESGIEYRVVKNTLARFAAERLGWTDLAATFKGPVALALGFGDLVEPARVLTGYIDAEKSVLTIKGGFWGDRLLTSEEVASLSRLPSREVLVASVLGAMQSPIAALVNCLNAPIVGIARVLQARINQLEEK